MFRGPPNLGLLSLLTLFSLSLSPKALQLTYPVLFPHAPSPSFSLFPSFLETQPLAK